MVCKSLSACLIGCGLLVLCVTSGRAADPAAKPTPVDLDKLRFSVREVAPAERWSSTDLRYAALSNTGKVAVAVKTKIRVSVDEAAPLVPDNPFARPMRGLPDDPHLMRERIVVWEDGKQTTLPGEEPKYAWFQTCVSADGTQLVGNETRTLGSIHVKRWDGKAWKSIDGPRGRDFVILGVNNAGTMVGSAEGQKGEGREAVVIRDGKWQTLPPAKGSVALAVSNSGLIVGQALDKSGAAQACLWRDDKPTLLGTLGGRSSKAHAVNDAGVVVGVSRTRRDEEAAFVWKDGEMRPIALAKSSGSIAHAVNDAGIVVGMSYGGKAYGFIAVGDTARNLNDLLKKGAEWRVKSAVAVNATNRVLAIAEREFKEYLVVLVPE